MLHRKLLLHFSPSANWHWLSWDLSLQIFMLSVQFTLREASAAFLHRSALRETIKLKVAKQLLFSLFQIVPLSASHLGAIIARSDARVISKESRKPWRRSRSTTGDNWITCLAARTAPNTMRSRKFSANPLARLLWLGTIVFAFTQNGKSGEKSWMAIKRGAYKSAADLKPHINHIR